ncbi:MAG: polyprenyl synthetase family protein [Halobacteriaceae archaeon]
MTTGGRDAVLDAVESRRAHINDALEAELPPAAPERLYEASRSIIVAGGKRLRPAMVLLVAEALADVEGPLDAEGYRSFPALDGTTVDVMAAAVSIEIVHSFTLIHDDIMDDDEMRRGVPAVHEAYDDATAILAGDTLYSKGFEILLRTGADPERSLAAVRTLAETCTRICEGQAMDVDFEGRSDVHPDEYTDMIERKTAVLYAAAAAVPAVVLGADDDTVDALGRYGRAVGQAFQIQDDVLDLTASSETLGKQRGSDLVEGKRTLITLHAREQGVDVDGLLDADDPEAVTEAEIDEAVAKLRRAGSIEYARETAHELVERGKDDLGVLPENGAHETLAALADYLVERGH